jgi:transcription termination/antitermination protein NusG
VIVNADNSSDTSLPEASFDGASSDDDSINSLPSGGESMDEHAEDGDESGGEPGVPGQKRKMRWYVVQAYSGYENKVKASLEERIRQYNMQDDFGEILIPREQVTETRGTAKRVTSRTFYPGYMFVQMNLTDESWHLVKDTPKVSGFVGGRYPTAVPASQINLVAQQVAEGAAKPKPRVVFEQGDHVRVVEGAFANFTGTIEEVKPEKQKVRVLVSIFGRATPVELDYAQVEKTV